MDARKAVCDERDNTKMDKLVKDQLDMSGHISKDVLKDEVRRRLH